MPTYQYVCRNCTYSFEELQSIKEEPLTRCPECHTDNLARVMGAGSGLIFKGSGFYLTDYKNNDGKSSTKTKETTKKETADGGTDKGKDSSPKAESKKETSPTPSDKKK